MSAYGVILSPGLVVQKASFLQAALRFVKSTQLALSSVPPMLYIAKRRVSRHLSGRNKLDDARVRRGGGNFL